MWHGLPTVPPPALFRHPFLSARWAAVVRCGDQSARLVNLERRYLPKSADAAPVNTRGFLGGASATRKALSEVPQCFTGVRVTQPLGAQPVDERQVISLKGGELELAKQIAFPG